MITSRRHDHVWGLLAEVRYDRSGFLAFETATNYPGGELTIKPIFRRDDAVTGEVGYSNVPARAIPADWDDGQIVRAAFAMIRAYEEHEVREAFLWRDRAVFGPHTDVEALWAISSKREPKGEC